MTIAVGTFLESKVEKGLIIKVVRLDDNKIYSENGNTFFAVNNKDWKEVAYDPTQVFSYWKVISSDNIPLSLHAEFWQISRGLDVPIRKTPEWEEMYSNWHEFAFQNF